MPTPRQQLADLNNAHIAARDGEARSSAATERALQRLSSLDLGADDAPLLATADHMADMAEELIAALPPPHVSRVPAGDLFCAGTLNTSRVNAQAVVADNGGWLVAVNEGLISFAYKIARALASRIDFEEGFAVLPLERDAWLEAAGRISPVIRWYCHFGVPYGPDFEVTREQMVFASHLATLGERFVIAHELSHHLLEHSLAPVPDGIEARHAEEYAADAAALQMLVDTWPDREAEHCAGAALFLGSLALVDGYMPVPTDTHPSARARLQHISERSALQHDRAPDKASLVDASLGYVADLLAAAHSARAQQDAPGRARDLARTLLARHAAAPGPPGTPSLSPDYVGFYDACLRFDGPELLLAVLEEGRVLIEGLRASPDADRRRRAKLAMGLVDQYPVVIQRQAASRLYSTGS